MNKLIIMGRLTKDPEIRSTTTGTQVARFALAVDRTFSKEGTKQTDFFPCVAWGKKAEFAEKFLKKGTKVLASGRFENNAFKNKEGQTVTNWELTLEEVEFAESKKAQEEKTEEKIPDWMPASDLADDELPFNF